MDDRNEFRTSERLVNDRRFASDWDDRFCKWFGTWWIWKFGNNKLIMEIGSLEAVRAGTKRTDG